MQRGVNCNTCVCANYKSRFVSMNVSATTHKTNHGTCPHGNPIGACPMCSGMSSGGSGSSTNKPRKPGEMTYEQCYAVWQQMLKAKALKEAQIQQQKLDCIKAQEKVQSFNDKILNKMSAIKERFAVVSNFADRVQNIFNRVRNFAGKTVGS